MKCADSLRSEFGHHVQQPQIVGRAVVERVERVGRIEHLAGGVLVPALGVEHSQPVARRRPPRCAASTAILYISAERGYCRIAASCSATSK